MGYRSDVTIRCEERAFQEFKTAWEKVDFKPSTILKAREDGKYTYILEWEWVKWYQDFEEVEKITNVCRTLDGKNEDGYAYKFIRIGEDNATEEFGNETGLDEFSDFYVVVSVNLPKSTTRVEQEDGKWIDTFIL